MINLSGAVIEKARVNNQPYRASIIPSGVSIVFVIVFCSSALIVSELAAGVACHLRQDC